MITNPSQDQHLVRFDVLTALLLGIQVFWAVKYCQVSSCQHFKGTSPPNDNVQSVSLQQSQQMAVWLLTSLYNHVPRSHMEVWIILGVQMLQLQFLKLRISKCFPVRRVLHLYQL
jgi:hypothetical protein